MQVFIQEHKACEVSLTTHCITGFTVSLPFLLLLPCLVAIVLIPLCNLNSSGNPNLNANLISSIMPLCNTW